MSKNVKILPYLLNDNICKASVKECILNELNQLGNGGDRGAQVRHYGRRRSPRSAPSNLKKKSSLNFLFTTVGISARFSEFQGVPNIFFTA